MMIRLALILFLLIQATFAQWNDWVDAASVKRMLLKAQNERKTYFSQFHVYDARSRDDIFSSKFKRETGENLYIYGLDFYYASGTYFDSTYKAVNRKNIVSIVKKMWREHRAIPSFSWHLENPYVPSSFTDYMGCRYRKSPKVKNYPRKHQYVVKEILEGTGDVCGFGRFQSRDDYSNVFQTPAIWFDERVKEVASIINDFVDEQGMPIPLLFRLWHEQEDGWMWWGKSSVSKEDYKSFFILTEKKIREYAPDAQILWGYGPDSYWEDEEEFLSWYPGDDYVDVIGYDDYQIGNPQKSNMELQKARLVTDIAEKHRKIAALFETANKEDVSSDEFFMSYLSPMLQDSLVHFGLVQIWSSGKFENAKQFQDRRFFLNKDFILKVK